jgi:hypothetical protein
MQPQKKIPAKMVKKPAHKLKLKLSQQMMKTALKTMLIQLDILLVKQIPRRSDPRQILPLLLHLVRAGSLHIAANRLFP